ncbi:helix-turn-helix domain-containing protein [Pseudactinotalea terrae]|uniref:helix-turn-helix domain-containing protein n=1 Tax=Pseudactinotalea terrae TaxID=1743262 RepID=UPI0012E1EA27|nr:helix-turn-helix domain-containing protein [Pseudactinotalea terrae]
MQATITELDEVRRARRTRYAAMRRRQIAYGQWSPTPEADRVRAHVQYLREHMTLAQIAEATMAAGNPVAVATIKSLLRGRGTDAPPTRQPRRRTARALLAVGPPTRLVRLRQLDAICAVLLGVGSTPQDLPRFLGPSLSGASMAELDARLASAFAHGLLELEGALPRSPRSRRAAAAHLLRKVFPRPLDATERAAVVTALCGPLVGMPVREVAELLRVSTRTVQRVLRGQRTSTATTAAMPAPTMATSA